MQQVQMVYSIQEPSWKVQRLQAGHPVQVSRTRPQVAATMGHMGMPEVLSKARTVLMLELWVVLVGAWAVITVVAWETFKEHVDK